MIYGCSSNYVMLTNGFVISSLMFIMNLTKRQVVTSKTLTKCYLFINVIEFSVRPKLSDTLKSKECQDKIPPLLLYIKTKATLYLITKSRVTNAGSIFIVVKHVTVFRYSGRYLSCSHVIKCVLTLALLQIVVKYCLMRITKWGMPVWSFQSWIAD